MAETVREGGPARVAGIVVWIVAKIAPIVLIVTAGARAAEPAVGRLRAHVATLASPEFEGRRGDGGIKAAAYVERAFRDLDLKPLFGDSHLQPIPGPEPGQVLGRNVGAILVGSDPKLRDEYVIVSAHFDHLGVRDGVLYPGADDNASGVAMLLETARCLARAGSPPRRSIIFLGFDLEEDGLWGSRYFVEHLPGGLKIEAIKLFLTADMLGRCLGGVCTRRVFVFGTERAPGLRTWVNEAGEGRAVKLGLLGSDVMVVDRSDYGPFRMRKVPYLFFSTGENPRYHRPDDLAETIDYDQLDAASAVILSIVRRAGEAEELPPWSPRPEPPPEEPAVIRDVLGMLLEHRDELRIKPTIAALMTRTTLTLDGVLARGTITPAERGAMVRVAQVVLFSVL